MGFGHGGNYICPCETIDTGIEKVFLRVMYSDDSVAVCYAAAEFDTAPYKVEALAAFDLTKSTDDSSSDNNSGSGSSSIVTTPYEVSDKCGVCNGKGKVSCMRCSGGKIDCQDCGGDGRVNLSLEDETTCFKCRGAGKVDCPTCNGSGEKSCTFCGGDGKR